MTMADALTLILIWMLLATLEALSPPQLRIEPEQPVYIVGESVTLRCVAEDPATIQSYNFHKDGAVVLSKDSSRQIVSLSILDKDASGLYSCTYTREGNISFPSNNLQLNVIERPVAPSLSLVPEQPIYFTGQLVTLSCLFQKKPEIAGVFLFRNGFAAEGADNFGGLTLQNIREGHAGNYTCSYRITDRGREVESQMSENRILMVTKPLLLPTLRFHPNSLQVPGEQVQLICESPNASIIKGYKFYKDGKERERSNSEERIFTITHYTQEFEGCYFCQTYKIEFGQKILSPESFEKFLTARVEGGRGCRVQDSEVNSSFSHPGILLYGTVLAGKLIVLISLMFVYGIHLMLIRTRKPNTQ
ncbi:Fc receptor-like protein 5 isoform 1-T1 [Discoglossus pictus]